MSEPRVTNQWQLEDTGESLEQWKLQDDEQRMPSHMQLQDDYDSPEMMDAAWQPIDYRAMQAAATGKSRRAGTALGALLVVALLGVGGYLAWFYMGQPGTESLFGGATTAADASRSGESLDPEVAPIGVMTDTTPMADLVADPATTAEDSGAAAAPADAPADVMTSTAPVAAPVVEPVATPAPTLPATAEVRQAVVNSQYGVNLRAAAAGTAELLATLDDQSTHVVASGPTTDAAGANWYELALPDNTRGWVSGDFITVTVQNLPYADAQALLATVGLTLTAPEAAPVTEAAPSTTVTGAVQLTETVQPEVAPVASDDATVRLSAVITAVGGLNLRRAAEQGDNVITQLADATPVTVVGRSADGAWLQLELADGRRGWVSSQFVTVTGDINSIPAGASLPLTSTVSALLPVPTAAPVAATDAPTSTAAAAPAAGSGTSAAFTVTGVMGVNLRPEPSNDSPGILLSWNTSGEAVGRTADSVWVQVSIPGGQSGWVAASAVSVAGGVESLPVSN
jgi:uncharacterized protein YgiM (DUF1202 family)